MNEIIPKNPISIRPAVAGDLAFIDALQKKHSKQVGWMQTMALLRKIELGEVLVAWASRPCLALERQNTGGTPVPREEPIGYCIGQDRYFKRDDVGIIYQLNVAPGNQRGLVGASLLKAQFEKSAWGCRLYCCWCAQDIEANRFWEAMGFVALAFRAGSEKKSRVHIFWQRRIRSGDETTPYWFPSQTTGGSIREDRLVLPIQPGEHWSEAKPMFLPTEERVQGSGSRVQGQKRLPSSRNPEPGTRNPTQRRVQFGRPSDGPEEKPVAPVKKEKIKKEKRKNDPRLVSAARELRDRWLEQVNAPGGNALLVGCGKYDVSRMIARSVAEREGFFVEAEHVKQLAA
jgi:hypothetical protein